MTKAIVLDSETTGLPPKGEACEIAYFETILETAKRAVTYLLKDKVEAVAPSLLDNDWFSNIVHKTFMPKGDFHPKASECNGFTKEKLTGSPCISTFVFPTDVTYMIGHNIMFDYDILKQPKGVKLICTKELAIKYLTKESGKGTKGVNTLTGLIERYYPEEAKELIANAHSALQDCKLCYLILLKILEAAPELDSFDKLARQCKQPSTEVKLPRGIRQDSYTKECYFSFGKYEDKTVESVAKADPSYCKWLVEKSTLQQELKEFVKQVMLDNK